MEAIVELFVALIAAFVEAVAAVASVVLLAVFHGVVFLLTALFSGWSTAKEKRQQRLTQAAVKDASVPLTTPEAPPEVTPEQRHQQRRKTAVVIGVWAFLLTVILGAIWWNHVVQQRRIDTTKIQIELLADQFALLVEQPKAQLPERVLADQDAWGEPCELFVDDWGINVLIVVRSAGSDRKTGTIDDLLSVRFCKAPPQAVGKAILNRGMDALKDQLKKRFPGLKKP